MASMSQLDRRCIALWHVENAVGALLLVLSTTALALTARLSPTWQAVVGVVVAAAIVVTTVEALVLIPRRYRYYRYGVADGCLVVEQGKLWRRRHLYPLARVLYCETRQGPLLRLFDLYTVRAGTLVETRSIGPVSKGDAEQVERAIRASEP